MLGFDRGGAYPQVFAHCREQQRALGHLPAGTAGRPRHAAGHHHHHHTAGGSGTIAWAEEKVQLKDYGEARQITLFEHGKVALQILTSDFDACPADILSWLKSRWREENFLKYASRELRHRQDLRLRSPASRRTPRSPDNPARKAANAAVRDAEKDTGRRRAGPRRAARRPRHHRRRQERRASPPLQRQDHPRPRTAAAAAAAARKASPRNCPPTRSTPKPGPRCCAPGAAACRWSCGCSPTTPSTGSSNHLNAYLRDDDEYRAITRETIIRGLAGTITYTPAAITVTPRAAPPHPASPAPSPCSSTRSTPHPPAMPGDTRPITYQIPPQPGI